MTLEQWQGLQSQLWSAFHPLIHWWLVFLMVGFIAAALFLFGAIFLADWLD
jgi:hypothetical protein